MSKTARLAGAMGFLIVAHPVAAQNYKAHAQQLREIVEHIIKIDFDQGMTEFLKGARANNPHGDAGTLEAAKDGVRMMFYNKAYNLYLCAKSVDTKSLKSSDERSNELERCSTGRNKEVVKNFKIVTQYESFFSGKGLKTQQCEIKARLFDGEIEFPPFDFLKRSDGINALYDYAVMNACLLSLTE